MVLACVGGENGTPVPEYRYGGRGTVYKGESGDESGTMDEGGRILRGGCAGR